LINEVLEDSKKNESNRLETEADSLLKAAQKALFMDKAMNKNTTVVNADELLKEVENEVEPSLKSKVYEVFKDGFKKVKTAVVQRNN
jgi:thymidylate kinase